MALVLRSVKGANLTPTEVDGNFTHLDDRIDTEIAGIAGPAEIVNVTQSADGTQFTLHLSDATEIGPIDIPSAVFEFQGEWAAATGYQANDFITYERAGLYLVLQDHTSEASFDPTEENTDGRYYQLVMELFSGSAVKTVSFTSYSPVLTDTNKYIRCTSNSGCTVTIPLNADVEFPVNGELHFRQAGDGTVSIVGDGGVTINPSRPDFATDTPWKGAVVAVKKIDTDTWDFIGPGAESSA